MKKSLTLGIIGIVIISSCGALVLANPEHMVMVQRETMKFSTIQVKESSEGAHILLAEATSSPMTPGSYNLPVVTRVFTFPFLTKITDVSVQFSGIQEHYLSQPVRLVSQPVMDTAAETMMTTPLQTVPTTQYSYHLGAGRSGDEQVLYVAVHLSPVQYSPSTQVLTCAQQADISISYELPTTPFTLADEYDLLILCPEEFAAALQPLVDHKTQHGVAAKLVTHPEVCDGTYFPAEGRDCAEEFKYFIKNAFDEWGIKYVLLVGGRKGGIMQEKWWIPVRYSNLDDSSGMETSYLTDLYFADLYDSGGNFSSWDTDGDGVFAEWKGGQKDILDMYPEVFVGRLACKRTSEVKTMVEKIISYETTTYGSDWFKKFMGVAGDTYPDSNDESYEGEMATNTSYNFISGLGFDATFLWTSTGAFSDSQDVIDAFSEGYGFVHFSGHGNPSVWSNHLPLNSSFISGLTSFQMGKLKNGEQQPVVIVGGCHNSQFNTSLLNIIRGVIDDGFHYFSTERPDLGKFWYKEWVPQCWSWAMAQQSKGGCIAIIANTGLGYGEPGPDTLTRLGRFLEVLFFRSYSEGKTVLGETHAQDIVYYMNEYPPMDDNVNCKVIQEWALLGDPSLQIGGYAS